MFCAIKILPTPCERTSAVNSIKMFPVLLIQTPEARYSAPDRQMKEPTNPPNSNRKSLMGHIQ